MRVLPAALALVILAVPGLPGARGGGHAGGACASGHGHGGGPPLLPDPREMFQRRNPCPSTGKRSGPCPGYAIGYAVPLAAGGHDLETNMRWEPAGEPAPGTGR